MQIVDTKQDAREYIDKAFKLGIKYADGIGFLAENEELAKYAEGLGKPTLQPVAMEDFGIHYPTFYDTIWNIGRVEEEEG